MRKLKLILILIMLFGTGLAYANCTYNGSSYPTGTRIGPLVCQSDGSWR